MLEIRLTISIPILDAFLKAEGGKSDHILKLLRELAKRSEQEREQLMASLDGLKAQVAKNTEVAESAIVLIKGIADRIAAAGVDQGELDKLVADLNTEDQALADAVAANTPAG